MKSMMLMTAALATTVAGTDLTAQVSIRTAPGGFSWVTGAPDRPMIGVSTRSSGKRDTLGLLIESVTRDGPAAQSGIEEGDRLVSVNGVNLRLSADDAGEADMAGIATRRLVRELERQEPGDSVELRVYRDGAVRTVRLRTVAAEELTRSRVATSDVFDRLKSDRAVLGLSLGGTGSPRDTSGILVVGVSDEGPAAKAGLDEGDRIAAINGVDLRVAREDGGDWQASRARVNRLHREMEKVKAGDAVELRVVTNGQARTVRVEAAKASDVGSDGGSFYFSDFTGALRGLQAFPKGAVRVIPRGSADLKILPKVQLDRSLRSTIESIRSKVDIERRLRILDRPAIVTLRRASAA